MLVEDDGNWKIDDFTDLARLDRERFTARIEGEFEKEGLGPPEVRCLVAALDEFPRTEFEELALGADEKAITEISEGCEAEIEADREIAREERESEREIAKEEREIEQEELAEIEAEGPAEYPHLVQQTFLKTCLATSGSNFDVCECALDTLEANYTVKEVEQAEADIASGRMREIVESTFGACA